MPKKRPTQKVIDIAQEPAQTTAIVPAPSDDAPLDDPYWTPQREKALRLALRGIPKMQIAKEVDVHRNTINNWFTDPKFANELNQRMREHMAATRVRRMQSTNTMTDRIERVAGALMKDVETKLFNDDGSLATLDDKARDTLGRTLRMFREMGYEFREFREQERKDYGDDVKKVAINQTTSITGDVQVTHSTTNDTPFAEYLKRTLDTGVIDVTALQDTKDDGQLLLTAAEHMLVDSDILDLINEEDKEAEEAAKR